MNEHARGVEALIEEVEASLIAAEAALGREERRLRWSGRVDGAATVVILTTLGAAFVGAGAPLSHRVKAPFVVEASDSTRTIFKVTAADAVETRGFILLRPSSTMGAAVAAETVPLIKALSADKSKQAAIGVADGRKPTLVLRYGNEPRLSATVDGDQPVIDLTNDANVNIVELGQGELGAGYSHEGHLWLGDARGFAMVVAGTAKGDVGAVQTYPNGNSAALTFFGLPGTFICGVGCSQR